MVFPWQPKLTPREISEMNEIILHGLDSNLKSNSFKPRNLILKTKQNIVYKEF